MNLANASIAQVMIPVVAFDRAVLFYRDVLGLPFLFAAPPQMAFFQCGSVRLLVGVMPAGNGGGRGSGVYFRVDDIDGVHATLRDSGVKFAAGPHVVHRTSQSVLCLAEFNDPDGNPLALMSEVPVAAA